MNCRRRAKVSAIIGLVIMLVVVSSSYYEESQPADAEGVRFLIGVSQANLVEPWRVTMNEEIKEEALNYQDVRLVFTDAAQSSQKQIKDVEELLEQGIDLLIISPNDAVELTPIVAKAYKKIPVIVLDRGVEGYEYTLYIGPDNKAIGREAGKYVAELIGAKQGRVVEFQGPAGLPSVKERSSGFREVLQSYDNIEIAATIVADWQRDAAEDKMAELLAQVSNVDVVFAHSDYMALGAYKAAKKQGITTIKFVGIDGSTGSKGGLKLVEEGILSCTFTCLTGGREAVQYALDILHHERGIPKKIITRSNKITKNNLISYISSLNEPVKDNTKKKIVLGYSQIGAESAWRKANSQSIKNAALAENIEMYFQEAAGQQKKQIEAIESFIDQGVDVIAFSPVVETGWDEVLAKAKAAGIPVIICDRAIKPNDTTLYTAFIGSDFLEEGRRAARWLMENSPQDRRINIVELEGTIGSAPAVDRELGFAEYIADNPRYQVIYSASGDFTQEDGKSKMKEALQKYGDLIEVVYAHNDDMAIGAIEALEEYGLKPGRDVLIVSVDGTDAAFNAMAEGKLNCTVECTPFLGPQIMQAVKALMTGRQLPVRIISSEGVFPASAVKQSSRQRRY